MERLDYRLSKAELYLQLLCKCDDSNDIPNFLNFRLANSHLKYSSTYRLCQSNLLKEEIRQKKSSLRSLQKEFSPLKVSLQNGLNFAHVSTLFFGINDKIFEIKKFNSAKNVLLFYKLLQESKTESDPKKLFLTFSSTYFPILKRIYIYIHIYIYIIYIYKYIYIYIYNIYTYRIQSDERITKNTEILRNKNNKCLFSFLYTLTFTVKGSCFLFENVTNQKLNDKTFKILLHFDLIFYKSSTDYYVLRRFVKIRNITKF